ncbi:hypothetical protein N8198_09275 [Gammaproteobacteria bacterium]|nr:hypothetical protein [Gammaproteobacteria bacterium]
MQEYYEVSPSRSQLIFLLAGHLLGAIAIYFYLSPVFLKWTALAALAVAGFIESRRLIQHDIILLRINLARTSIEVQHLGQPYFYSKYKVYQTRWFAILKLIDQQANRTLILNSDCFTSIDNYRRLRFDLRCLERSDAA